MCLELVNNFANATDPTVCMAFFQQYYLTIVQDTFFVLLDADHKSGFKLQTLLLARMFQLVEQNIITAPLFDPSQINDPNATNALGLQEYCVTLLHGSFPHTQPYV